MLRRFTWTLLTRTAALLFAPIPKRSRFRVAVVMATVIAPIAGAWLQRRAGRPAWCSAPFDEAMRLVMRILADGGVTFDPRLVIDSTVALDRRALFVSGHFPILGFFLRYAYEQHVEPVVVKAFPDIDVFVWGTRDRFDSVDYSPAVLVKLHRRIEAGHPAVLLIDMDRGSTVPFESAYGNGYIATRVFEFAKRFDIPMFFLCVRCDRTGAPVIVIRPLPPEPGAFIANLTAQAALLRR